MLSRFRGELIVSCQANDGEPLARLPHIVALAESARIGGAGGLRVDGADAVAACSAATGLPVIGIKKVAGGGPRPMITPRLSDFQSLARAGADVIAFDASYQYQPDDKALAELVGTAAAMLKTPLMADISTLEEAERAIRCGADFVATTLWGYTPDTVKEEGPAMQLARTISDHHIPVLVEGRIDTPSDVADAFDAGAIAVIVGSAITNPVYLTKRFLTGVPRSRNAVPAQGALDVE